MKSQKVVVVFKGTKLQRIFKGADAIEQGIAYQDAVRDMRKAGLL
jgi:hypothetical protein